MNNKTVPAFFAGIVVALAGVMLRDASHHVTRIPGASTTAVALATDLWPTAPATIIAGTPNFRGNIFSTSSDGKTISGTWAADGPSRFDWHYPVDEAVYIHEGNVEVDYLGKHFILNPGDTAHFHAGTTASWTVPEKVRKSWTIHHVGPLVRWWRALVASTEAA